MAISVKMLGTTTTISAKQMQTRKSLGRLREAHLKAQRPHVVSLTRRLLTRGLLKA